jgi:UrcA family protein
VTHILARIGAALALAGAAISTPAFAALGTETLSVVVPTADLNLASEAGQASLARRIDAAATRICGPADSRNLQFWRATRACHADAVAGAGHQAQLARAGEAKAIRLAMTDGSVTALAF